jgi:formylglycine-generating enzyme required for sulfatase activity
MKQTKRGSRFIPAFLLFSLLLLVTACSLPGGNIVVPPAAPAAPSPRPGNKKLILSWQTVPGAASYDVFYWKNGTAEPGADDPPAQTVNVPVATISGLENGTNYSVKLRAKNSAGASAFSSPAAAIPAVQMPSPSVIRGDGRLSIGWAAEEDVNYEVWYGTSGDSGAAGKGNDTITPSGVTAGTTITGLTNGTVYYVWIKTLNSGTGGFGAETAEIPEAPASVPEGFVYVSGGTVTGSGDYALIVTVPDNSTYTGAGTSSVRKGVFVEDRRVSFDSFVMAKHETTQDLWYTVQDWALANGYSFQNENSAPGDANKNKPVTGISWRDAIVWCNAYSEKEGLEPVYHYNGSVLKDSTNAAVCDGADMDKTKSGYRLPTDVEREFTARGGDPGTADWMYRYAGSDNADAVWHHGNSPYQTRVVGTKDANRLGIFDLSGNVQEWCWDWMNWAVDITPSTPVDGAAYSGTAPLANQKAFNGGGVGSNITMSCVAYRWGYLPDYKDNYVGFRVVRKP